MDEIVKAAVSDVLSVFGLPTSLGELAVRKVVEERERRVSKALGAAEALTGLTREELGSWIAATPEAVPLVVRVLQAAGSTGNDRTLAMLGRALGELRNHPSTRSRQELIVVALDGLTDEHLDVISVCTAERVSTEVVVERLDGRVPADLAPMALTSMVSRGLFANPYGGFGGKEMWALSFLGLAVKDAALAAYPNPTHD